MGLPTPRYVSAVGAGPEPSELRRSSSPTPIRLEPVAPPPKRVARHRPRWTLMLVPPPRIRARVRSVELKRRHLIPPLAMLAFVLAFISYSSAQVGVWNNEAMLAPDIEQLHERFDAAEQRLRVLTDSLALVGAQTAALTAARGQDVARAASLGAGPGVILPVDGRITSRYAPRRLHPILRINRPHRGLDIAAAEGTPIRAPAAGRVARVARELGYGLVVHIDHGDGLTTRYAHCKSILVKEGQLVDAGAQIATVGSSGLATASHVHFEVRVNGEARDPMRTPVEYTR